ncbi:MAG: hypothetical protein HY273_10715 [Gammaproteobacteria bacterium]|nr:hypothetical protein [Gammaproteobacteria bacterium]
MKPIAALTEYGITGGVLLVNLFIFATLLNLQIAHADITFPQAITLWQRWAQRFAELAAPFAGNKLLEPVLSTLIATLSVILIFCTGLLLELTAPLFFTLFEILAFKRWLARKDYAWVGELMQVHEALIENDYRRFVNDPPLVWWLPQRWLAQRARYTRLQSFIFSYLFFNARGTSLEQLQEQIRLWRTSRAVSTSMIILGIALTGYAQDGGNLAEHVLIVLGIPVALFAISALTTLTIYSRLCMTLCSLLYLSSRNETSKPAT